MASSKSSHLVIVESPAKAKTISRFLGPGYRVEASYGHVRDLPQSAKEIPTAARKQEWARLGVNVDADFEPLYVVPADKKKHVQRLKEAVREADRLLLATDEDREGESISWHVLEVLRPKGIPIERIVFHEVTPEAIQAALGAGRAVDENLVRAQEARRVLDRLYGYSLSPLLWKRVAPGLSAGRVQSVAVRLLVERERERIAFVASDYWDLRADLSASGGRFRARLARVGERRLAEGKSFDASDGSLADRSRLHLLEAPAKALAEAAGQAKPWRVVALERSPGSQKPSPPFITSTLQQEGNRKLGLSARQVMRVAQQLYEGIDLAGERIGLITYMRTDSVALAERAVEQARAIVAEAYGKDFLPPKPVVYRTSAKRAQEAHEAIRPTDLSRRPQDLKPYLDADQLRLYELIWKRTLACQMVPARFERTAVEIGVDAGGEKLFFTASGRRIVHAGFLRAYVEGSDDPEAELGDQETLLPALAEGQTVAAVAVEADGHRTAPPYRYTEASLVKKLEEEGIGRPSTYASILSTIVDRGYVFKRGNELVPTFTAFCVTRLLEQQFADLVDTRFTALMEDDLDAVAAGKRSWTALLQGFYLGTDGHPGLSRRVIESEVTYPAVPLGLDPESGEELSVKVGKYGPYVRRGEGGSENVATVPENMPPDQLTVEVALGLLKRKSGETPPIATDPGTGRAVTLQHGRFGDYLELAQSEEEKAKGEKPRRVSLPRGLAAADVTAEVAVRLIALPRSLGRHPESGLEVSTGIGRYGPYLRHGDEYRSLSSWQETLDLGLQDAVAVLATPKPSRRKFGSAAPKAVLVEIGELPDASGPVRVLDGRYGPYVTDGKTHASLPKGTDPSSVTPELAAELLAKKRAAPSKRPVRRRR